MIDPLEDKVKLYGIMAGTEEKVLVATFGRFKEARKYAEASRMSTVTLQDLASGNIPPCTGFCGWSVLSGFSDYLIEDRLPGIPHNPQTCRGG
ncbi:MAG TPA: hypothetical protein EYG51_08165 [Pseudomonadales bacterium]|nr:hypothetical protein [Pseudomonadales bacterium]